MFIFTCVFLLVEKCSSNVEAKQGALQAAAEAMKAWDTPWSPATVQSPKSENWGSSSHVFWILKQAKIPNSHVTGVVQ